MSFIKSQEIKIKKLLESLEYEIVEFQLEKSNRPEFGMYQYNGAMSLAKKYHQNPRVIADAIVKELSKNPDLENINIQGPGFINLSFKDEAISEYMNELLKDAHIAISKYPKKTIVLDYGGANVAKVLHVGHLRSANIGEALRRLACLCGYNVISDVHLGDFGRQMGMIILEIKNRYPDLPYFDEKFIGEYPLTCPITNQDLETIYPIANKKAKENEDIMNEAREITNDLQKGHAGYTALWKTIVELSVADIKALYDLLGAKFDYWYGESDTNRYIPELTEYLNGIHILKKSDGATIIDVSKDEDKKEIPPFIYIKSNGSLSYEATDLATIYQRNKEFKPDQIWYVVDNRQELHFIQTFRAAYLSKIIGEDVKLEFLGFGTMNGVDGKPFKTRDGGVMPLEELIKEVKEECLKYVSNNLEEKEKIAEQVAIACLKYADLLPNRNKDYIFDVAKFCDVQGKTGAYLLYSTVRIRSLLKKSEVAEYHFIKTYNKYDKEVVLKLLELTKVVDNALKNKSLSEICEYLYSLNSTYNNFYNEIKILTEENEEKRTSWLGLSKIVYEVNKMLLDILAIKVPERM